MFVRDITFVDLDGNTQTEKHQFHLSKVEVLKLDSKYEGGLQALIDNISKAKTTEVLIDLFSKLILMSYGVRDGNRFKKNDELTKEFEENPAFDQLFMELATNEAKGAEFVIGILPKDVAIDGKSLTKEAVAEALGAQRQMPAPPTT